MVYKHKSGSLKRKEKKERERNAKKPKIETSPKPFTSIHQEEFSEKSTNIQAEAAVEKVSGSLCQPQPSHYVDIGDPNFEASRDLKYLHEPMPKVFPKDVRGHSVPTSIFKMKLTCDQEVNRDWLVWSPIKQAFFCIPCKIFSTVPKTQRSCLTLDEGFSGEKRWKRLYDIVPLHERSIAHKSCYITWKREVIKSKNEKEADVVLKDYEAKEEKYKEFLRQELTCSNLLDERCLAFRGTVEKIGAKSNGNFLGLLEVVSNTSPIMKEHLDNVRAHQEGGKKMQANYFSPAIQNEFTELKASHVLKTILEEREKAKYYSVIVDATADCSRTEQNAIMIRYANLTDDETKPYSIEERLLCLADCSKKTGKDIAQLILGKLEELKIPLDDCRGQGYDNGSNMRGKFKGAQAIIQSLNKEAIYSACTCHSLNLCGGKAAKCCPEAINFFQNIEKLYSIFSSSPQRWEIVKKKLPRSLHSMSKTRWSARVNSVKPIASHLPSIVEALKEFNSVGQTSNVSSDVDDLLAYFQTFNCLLLASIWFKILKAIDLVNRSLQARGLTMDVASKTLNTLLQDLKNIRNDGWDSILSEVQAVAMNIKWPGELEGKIIGKDSNRLEENAFTLFKLNVFDVILDNVIGDMTLRFESVTYLYDTFSVLWSFNERTKTEINEQAQKLLQLYPRDLNNDLIEELHAIKIIYPANFGKTTLQPLELLNKIKLLNFTSLFPNISIGLRIFVTIPSTVASAERCFSKLKIIKSVYRSNMRQARLSNLAVLAVNSDLASRIDPDAIILEFSKRKNRRGQSMFSK